MVNKIKKTNPIKTIVLMLTLMLFVLSSFSVAAFQVSQPMTDTGQNDCYSNDGQISFPSQNSPYFGQDAQYTTNPMAYRDNGGGTVSDLVTGLMWSKAVDETKVSLVTAHKTAEKMTLGGYSDWRVPNIKELYSLMNFSGNTGFNNRNLKAAAPSNAIPYINTDFFEFRFGNTVAGERYIDAQWLSSTRYVSTTMNGAKTLFGVNFADGRIKGYGYSHSKGRRPEKKFYARYVRGNRYGTNDFKDNKDGTVSDNATGLMWMKTDSGKGMNWSEALTYAENFEYGGYNDWRLPNAKELQYIVDYTRSPDTTDSAAIDSVFDMTPIKNEKGQTDYPYFWTSTTHLDGPQPGNHAVYISFGRAMGKMRGTNMDVHGAGAQRSDPKKGQGHISRGPQGDWVRVNNFVRLVRGGSVTQVQEEPAKDKSGYPYKIKVADNKAIGKALDPFQTKQLERQPPQPGHRPDQPPDRMGFVLRLDKDGDGKVSRSEFDGPRPHFFQLDTDQDGYLSEDEAPKGPPPRRKVPRQ